MIRVREGTLSGTAADPSAAADGRKFPMGYGLGVFLLALGLILAFAVQDAIDAIDLTMIGYILAGAGVLIVVLTAVQTNRTRQHTTVATTTHPDGSQSVAERRTEQDPPPPAV